MAGKWVMIRQSGAECNNDEGKRAESDWLKVAQLP